MSVPTQQWAQRDDVHEQMADMLMGYRVSQALRAYAELSVADHLANGPLTAAEIAQREGSAPETTCRLMRRLPNPLPPPRRPPRSSWPPKLQPQRLS